MAKDGAGWQPARTLRLVGPRFVLLLGLFLVLNLLAAHVMSDCGLPAVLGIDRCSDDIVRVGWPLPFFEQGGLAFHSSYDPSGLADDLILGALGALLIAVLSVRVMPGHDRQT